MMTWNLIHRQISDPKELLFLNDDPALPKEQCCFDEFNKFVVFKRPATNALAKMLEMPFELLVFLAATCTSNAPRVEAKAKFLKPMFLLFGKEEKRQTAIHAILKNVNVELIGDRRFGLATKVGQNRR